MSISLKGLTVVNTRPAHQAESLSRLISQAGGTPIEFPVLEISPPLNSESLQAQLSTLKQADYAIFVSANAVEAAMSLLGGAGYWPVNVKIISVGRATSHKLSDYGLAVSFPAPEPFNSEALLTTPELDKIADKRIVIFRGEGGRELLGKTLRSRGAEVEYIECYRRLIPASDPSQLYQCWDKKCDTIIVVTSNEGLSNLIKMIANEYQQSLLTSTLVVVSKRAVSLAAELGFVKEPGLAATVTNEAIVEAIQHLHH